MGVSIAALFVYIFGAYAYGSLLLLTQRHRAADQTVDPDGKAATIRAQSARASLRLFAVCAVWFVLHAIIEFRALLGEPKEDDLLDLLTLELVFLFPAVIFQSYLLEVIAEAGERPQLLRWRLALWGFYVAGIALASYFTLAIFGYVPRPQPLGRWLGLAIGAQFSVMSICALVVRRASPRRHATPDQRRLGHALNLLFIGMIVVFIVLNVMQSEALMVIGRATPLAFLIVSMYYESRIAFYDLVIKRGVLLVVSLVLTGTMLAVTINSLAAIPDGPARPWIFAVLLLPVAMIMPWLHDRLGRLLDRWWLGREFTPVEAVKRVLGAMQQAADEEALIRTTEAALSDVFRRPILIIRDQASLPEHATVLVDVRTATTDQATGLAVVHEPGTRPMLSEDLALARSLGSVFGYMLDNVRLQRRRREQEQLAQELRLQSSRSELKALRAQINPHFLFNALNAIASLIHTDPARADAAVEQLAEVFRYTLRRSEHEWAPLDQELALARAYLDVEQARFGKRLEYAIHAGDGLSRVHVPSMLLQTLVENAVKHGISRLRTPGRIDVRAARANGRVTLEVRDTGPGLDNDARTGAGSGESFGLRSVRERLHGHFGERASLDLRREQGATIARIELPLVDDHSIAAGARG
jgi:signal transduction histidine kinase